MYFKFLGFQKPDIPMMFSESSGSITLTSTQQIGELNLVHGNSSFSTVTIPIVPTSLFSSVTIGRLFSFVFPLIQHIFFSH